MPTLPFHLLQGPTTTSAGTALAIILATFILEDATMVAVGVMAADRLISVPLGLGSLATGIALGDLGLYGIGRLAITHPRLRRWVHSERFQPFRSWLDRKLYSTVIAARFLPGARLPTYLACGFFAVPFRRFGIPVAAATIVWSTLLFASSYYFGLYTLGFLGLWRWPIAFACVAGLYLAGRAHWKRAMRRPHG
ncbi:MAG TPA: VTT domain-containing protein [Rhizomicrobium sp.]|nr:VTT domain-containing protein [Rhizomicrobium sp.]